MKNPSGMCRCGCGQPSPRSSVSRRGYKRGEPLLFIKGHSSRRPIAYSQDKKTGCWNWKRPLNSYGYGRVTFDGVTIGAHCYFYSLHKGEIPKDSEIHHLCGNAKCINPNHLIAVTRRQHMKTDGRKAYGRYQLQ